MQAMTLPRRWVLVPWEFAKFNLFQAGSAMYGSHPWHWNFTQGLPTITVTQLPLAMWGVYLSRGRYEACKASICQALQALQLLVLLLI